MMVVEMVNGRVLYPELGKMAEGWRAPRSARHALILGGLLTLAGIANNLMLPPPAWFWLPTLLVFLPAAFAGARMATSGNRASA